MQKARQYTALAVMICMILFLVAPVLAGELEDQQQDVQRQMQQQKNVANQAQQRVDSVSEQLRQVQTQLTSAQQEYKQIQSQLQATEQQIKVNKVILAKTEKNLAVRSQILNKRLRDIYQNGQVSYLDVLLGANDFNDFATRMEILRRIMNNDVTLITQVKAERALVLEKKADLERDLAAIQQLKQAAEEKQKVVALRKNEQEKLLHAAVNDRDKAEQAYQELMEASQRIADMIRRRQAGSHEEVSSTGTMMWPIRGEITSPFGWRVHPVFGTARFHSGIDIAADYGDPVAAADSGVVEYAGWISGYGNAVIIDHGNGISTLYGHNTDLVVSEGQRVRKGQLIAHAGATGYATGPHVHFEVRQNGSPVDPMGYLP